MGDQSVFINHGGIKYEVVISEYNKSENDVCVRYVWNTETGEEVSEQWFDENRIDRYTEQIFEDLQENDIDNFLENFLS